MKLTWLPSYRTLAMAKTRADDDIRRLQAQVSDLQTQLQAALEDGRRSREMVADWIAQSAFGRPVYGVLPGASIEPPPDPEVMPSRPRAREWVRHQTALAYEESFHDSRDPAASTQS